MRAARRPRKLEVIISFLSLVCACAEASGTTRARAREAPGSRRPTLVRGVRKRFGATAGCPGCTFVQGKGPARPHTATCRTRLEGRIVREKEEELREALEQENALDPAQAQDDAREEDQEQHSPQLLVVMQ